MCYHSVGSTNFVCRKQRDYQTVGSCQSEFVVNTDASIIRSIAPPTKLPKLNLHKLYRQLLQLTKMNELIFHLTAVSVSVSGWTLVAISIERFYAICHPLTSRRWQTTRHARIVILIVWIISLAIMSPVAILSELKPVGSDGKQLSDLLELPDKLVR